MSIKPGDWVRFYRDGALVIAAVAYVHPQSSFRDSYDVYTDRGMVASDRILETRAAP